jgi:hypothetical protein
MRSGCRPAPIVQALVWACLGMVDIVATALGQDHSERAQQANFPATALSCASQGEAPAVRAAII